MLPAISKHPRLSIFASSLFLIALLLFSKQVAALPFSRFFSALSSGTTIRASDSSEGVEGNGWSNDPDISADGRFTVFESEADNLVANDYNQARDVFLYDKLLDTTEVIAMGNYSSSRPSISADGRFVAFSSRSDTFVPNDLNGERDVFVYDRWQGAMELVSVNSAEEQTDFSSSTPTISAGGRYVSFTSIASNLVPDDTNHSHDVFIRDRQLGITERVSVSSTGQQAEKEIGSSSSALSADGRFVVFASRAGNLAPGDTNDAYDIFVRDRSLGLTTLVSRNAEGQPGNDDSAWVDISTDGRYIVFESWADNLVPNDTNEAYDAFLYDQWTATIERISLTLSGQEANGHSLEASISADGRFITFASTASNMVPNDTNNTTDIFLLDRQISLLERVSVSSAGEEGNSGSFFPAIAADGRYIAFESNANNLVLPDTNAGPYDIFVRDQPFATLDINHPGGAPGSYFTLTGNHFPPTSTATLTVNGVTLGDVATDATGNATFLLHTTDATSGLYTVRLTVAPYSAETHLILHPTNPTHPQEDTGPIFDLPAGLAHHLLYFPFFSINTP